MHRLTSGKTTSCVSVTKPQSEETHDSAADVSVSLSPPIRSPQVTSSKTMRPVRKMSHSQILNYCVWQTLC